MKTAYLDIETSYDGTLPISGCSRTINITGLLSSG